MPASEHALRSPSSAILDIDFLETSLAFAPQLLDCLTENKAEVPDVLQILNILWLDEGMSVESIQKAVCRISSIQAQVRL